jgi:hypothetical protein
LLDTEFTREEKENMVSTLCKVTNDDEVDNRVSRIEYVEKRPEDAFRIKGLCEYAGVSETAS